MEIFTNKERKRFPLQKINNNGGIFEIKKCKCNCAGDLEEGDEIMYIGAKKDDNGFMKMVKKEEKLITKGNCIIFICDGEGSVGYSNYMDKDFIGSTTLSVGYNKHLNNNIGIFLVTLLDLERKKYSYGRKYGTNLSKTKIKLPIDNNGMPDREFMESYIKTLDYKPITTKNIQGKYELQTDTWKEFTLYPEYFDILPGKYYYSDEYEDGKIPYISASNENNGIQQLINLEPDFQGNCIITGKVGCTAFYQKYPFCATSDVNVFIPKFNMTQNVGLFITTIINCNENYRWSYGRQCRVGNSKKIKVKLPVDKNGEPDREFMENYIKNLPYGDRI